MCRNALLDNQFYGFLLRIDEDLAAQTQAGRCRRCGGVNRLPKLMRRGQYSAPITPKTGSILHAEEQRWRAAQEPLSTQTTWRPSDLPRKGTAFPPQSKLLDV
jgi:hypothetical protein